MVSSKRLVDLLPCSGSEGKFRRPKHISLGLGLDSLCGQKLPIMIFAKLGHSISYDTVSETETVHAELVLYLQSVDLGLSLQPAVPGNEVSNLLFMYDME